MGGGFTEVRKFYSFKTATRRGRGRPLCDQRAPRGGTSGGESSDGEFATARAQLREANAVNAGVDVEARYLRDIVHVR